MVDQSSFSYLKIVIICYEMWYPGILTPGIPGPGSEEQSPGESHLESAAAACAPVLAGTLPKAGAIRARGKACNL